MFVSTPLDESVVVVDCPKMETVYGGNPPTIVNGILPLELDPHTLTLCAWMIGCVWANT
jgi:hypothetical protein